jgi:hypothetical protein
MAKNRAYHWWSLTILIGVSIGGCDSRPPGGAVNENALVQELTDAIIAKDKQRFLNLMKLDDVSAATRNRIQKTTPQSFSFEAPKISTEPMSEEEKKDMNTGYGVFGWNAEPIGNIVITDGSESVKLPYGRLDERFYVITRTKR